MASFLSCEIMRETGFQVNENMIPIPRERRASGLIRPGQLF